jgi:acylglycerol lipase
MAVQYERVEGWLEGAGGVQLFYQGWLPQAGPRAVILICHGFGEHSGRYGNVVEALVPHGYAVYGVDHRGHGKSGGLRAQIDHYDTWLSDFDAFRRVVVSRHADVPAFVLGHSMGGNVALGYALLHQEDLAGLVLSGPAIASKKLPPAPAIPLMMALSRVLPNLPAITLDPDDISRDTAVVAAYRADPLVWHGKVKLRIAAEQLRGMLSFPDRVGDLKLPLLVLHGTADRLTDPAGSRMLQQRAGSPDKTVRFYDGLSHEVYNEPERQRVLADLQAWLDERAPGAPGSA